MLKRVNFILFLVFFTLISLLLFFYFTLNTSAQIEGEASTTLDLEREQDQLIVQDKKDVENLKKAVRYYRAIAELCKNTSILY